MKFYLKVVGALVACLVAGLAIGYLFNADRNAVSVLLSDGDFSELFTEVDSEIIIYTLPDCPFCHQLKDFLNTHQIIFDERSVADNRNNYEEVVNLGSDKVPVLVARSFMIEGFIEQKVSTILAEKGYIQSAEEAG